MVCKYCGKQVRDMVNHLRKHQLCHEKHVEKLKEEFLLGVHQALKKYDK